MINVYAVAAKTPDKPSNRGKTSGTAWPCQNPLIRKRANMAKNAPTIRVVISFTPRTLSAPRMNTKIAAIRFV